MIKVNFETDVKLGSKKIIILKKRIKKKFNKIYKEFSFLKRKDIIFSILLTTSSSIKKLNYKFRKKRKLTDVLSFPLYQNNKIKKSKQKNFYIGDIALCYEILKTRAKKSLKTRRRITNPTFLSFRRRRLLFYCEQSKDRSFLRRDDTWKL